MEYYIVEGMIQNAAGVDEALMKEHKAYTQKAMDDKLILIAGLKSDLSGGIFLMQCESEEKLKTFLSGEPFHLHGVQDYRVIPFDAHYIGDLADNQTD